MKEGKLEIANENLEQFYTAMEVAEIIGVTEQTVQHWCEKGKYPGAIQTGVGQWSIPREYFKITLEEAQKRNIFKQELNRYNTNFPR